MFRKEHARPICMGELIEYRQTKFTETIKVGKCSNFIKKREIYTCALVLRMGSNKHF